LQIHEIFAQLSRIVRAALPAAAIPAQNGKEGIA
jgi:hypothetical protein